MWRPFFYTHLKLFGRAELSSAGRTQGLFLAAFGNLKLLLCALLPEDPSIYVVDLLISVISERKDEKHSTSGYFTGWWLIPFLGIWAQCHSGCGEHSSLPHARWRLYPLDGYTKNERPHSLSRPHLNLDFSSDFRQSWSICSPQPKSQKSPTHKIDINFSTRSSSESQVHDQSQTTRTFSDIRHIGT